MGYQALLFCPDEKAARGVTQVLSELDFSVEPCTEPFAAVKKLMAQHFDAIVVDCDNEQNATLLFKSARNSTSNQSSLAVAVVEGQAGVAKAFRIGANLVLTKPINVEQAKGTLRVARGLLRKGGDSPKPIADQGTPSAAAAGSPVAPSPKAPVVSARPADTSGAGSTARPATSTKAWPSPGKPATPRTAKVEEKVPKAAPDIAAEAPLKPTGSLKVEAPKPVKPATVPAPSGMQTKYPWQASKPGAEPMASALKKAAEAAGISPTVSPESPSNDVSEISIPSTPTISGSAAAPAPAKEKPLSVPPAPAPLIEKLPVEAKSALEPEISVPAPAPEPEKHAENSHAPSFSMGAPAFDEEEPQNSKKAIVILAIVVVLASLAGYLAWRNMSDKSPAKAPTPQIQAPGAQPQQPTNGVPVSGDSVPTSQTAPVSSPSISDSVVTAPTAKPSAKMIAKDTTKPVLPAAPSDTQPATPSAPALVVHNETSRPAPKPNAADSNESAPAPSALGLTASADAKALSAISNAPVAVPKASSQVVRVSQGVSEGLILKKVQPRYPAQALQLRIEGPVQMQATVSKDGSISNVKILSGDPMLARAAQDAVRQWKYKPYYLDGEPVDIQTQITINFRLPK